MTDFDNLFPDVREQGSTLIVQCQLVMLRMLKILDYICRKHDIEYFLVGGSLLGAIRHKGFIPWDDDLDIGMTRDNYDKFVQLGVSELPADIFFQTPETDSYFPASDYLEAKLRDKYSSYSQIGTLKNKWHEGLQVDIFVYDRSFLPCNFLIITQNVILKLLKNNKKRANVLKWISNHSPFELVYASNYLHSYGLLRLGKNFIKAKEIASLVTTKFEDMEVYIPGGWDDCLKRQYGNYMPLPPPEKRISNHTVLPDPFKPCNHAEILHWEHRIRLR